MFLWTSSSLDLPKQSCWVRWWIPGDWGAVTTSSSLFYSPVTSEQSLELKSSKLSLVTRWLASLSLIILCLVLINLKRESTQLNHQSSKWILRYFEVKIWIKERVKSLSQLDFRAANWTVRIICNLSYPLIETFVVEYMTLVAVKFDNFVIICIVFKTNNACTILFNHEGSPVVFHLV